MHVARDSVLKFASHSRIRTGIYIYASSKEHHVKQDASLCRVYSLIARRYHRADAKTSYGRISHKRLTFLVGEIRCENTMTLREKWHVQFSACEEFYENFVVYIYFRNARLPPGEHENGARIIIIYSLFFQVTWWQRVNVTGSTEKLELSRVKGRNNGQNFIRGERGQKDRMYTFVRAVPPLLYNGNRHTLPGDERNSVKNIATSHYILYSKYVYSRNINHIKLWNYIHYTL